MCARVRVCVRACECAHTSVCTIPFLSPVCTLSLALSLSLSLSSHSIHRLSSRYLSDFLQHSLCLSLSPPLSHPFSCLLVSLVRVWLRSLCLTHYPLHLSYHLCLSFSLRHPRTLTLFLVPLCVLQKELQSVLQCVAVCCSVLQCFAVSSSLLLVLFCWLHQDVWVCVCVCMCVLVST